MLRFSSIRYGVNLIEKKTCLIDLKLFSFWSYNKIVVFLFRETVVQTFLITYKILLVQQLLIQLLFLVLPFVKQLMTCYHYYFCSRYI